MLKNITFPLGIEFEYNEPEGQLRLTSLFGMAAGYTTNSDDYSRGGLFVVCLDKKRYENTKLKYTLSTSGNIITIVARPLDNTFTITSTWTLCEEYGIVHTRTTLKNDGPARILRRVYPRWTLVPGKYSVYSQLSIWSSENQGHFEPLQNANLCFRGRAARSTIVSTPYCAIRDEENNTALACHVIPRGNWSIHVRPDIISNESPCPVLEAGLSDEDLYMDLAAGREIELPDVLLQNLPEGKVENGAAPIQRYIIDKLLPENTKPLPVIYNGWSYRFTEFTHEQMTEQLAAAKKLGCEYFVIDSGWYKSDDGQSYAGDWRENASNPFGGNMSAFADEVRAAGLKFGFWMEPERWNLGIPVRKEHPEWFPSHSERIDLTQPAAAQYFHDVIANNVHKFGAEYIKLDFNLGMGYDEAGTELFDYYNVWRSILLQLHQEFPTLYIENCASGALKNDIDTTLLYDHFFVSDNAHPYETIRIRQGGMLRTPIQRTLNWLVLRPAPERYTAISDCKQLFSCAAATWDEAAIFPLHYVMLSAFIGFPGFSGDIAALPDDIQEDVKDYIDLFKANRDWLAKAHVTPLTNFGSFFDYNEYLVFQITSQDARHNWVLVFTNGMSRRSYHKFKLKGLKADQDYTLSQLRPKSEEPQLSLTGKELMDFGAPAHFKENMHIRFDAVLLEVTTK